MSACIGIEIFEQILVSDKNKARSRANKAENKEKRTKRKGSSQSRSAKS